MDLLNKGLDPLLLTFLKNNALTLTLAFSICIGVAKATPWKIDEVIIEVIWGPIRDLIARNKK